MKKDFQQGHQGHEDDGIHEGHQGHEEGLHEEWHQGHEEVHHEEWHHGHEERPEEGQEGWLQTNARFGAQVASPPCGFAMLHPRLPIVGVAAQDGLHVQLCHVWIVVGQVFPHQWCPLEELRPGPTWIQPGCGIFPACERKKGVSQPLFCLF